MINSMTGYARAEQQLDSGTLLWELRTVNHRYLEVGFRLPEGFRPIEADLKALIGQSLKRGKVDATLMFQPATDKAPEMELNEPLLDELLKHANNIADRIEDAWRPNALALLRWPGILTEKPVDTEALQNPAQELLATALKDLCTARANEGKRIYDMIEERLAAILMIVDEVKARLPEVLEASRKRMHERAAELEQKMDSERLDQEMLILAQKQDVAEELDRLQAHVAEIRDALNSGESVGRRLDFLMQELNREANTLGSKSADPVTSKAAVNLKVLIEQMREQIQNVE